jgi:hypothetical protein
MSSEAIIIGGQKLTIKVAPITVVFNVTQKDSIYPERVSITPEMTLEHFKSISEIDPYTACLFKMVIDDYRFPVTKKQIEESVLACKHIIGLFSLHFKLTIEGKKVVWKYPESFLHPRYQGNLVDVMILMNNIEDLSKFIRFAQKGYFDDFILGVEDEGSKIYKKFLSLKSAG